MSTPDDASMSTAAPRRLSSVDRRALVSTGVQFFANGALSASFIARAPQLRDQVDVSIGQFGLLLTAAALVGLASSLAAGRIVHRLTTRRVLQIGAVVLIGMLLVIGSASHPLTLLVGLAVFRFFDVLVDISMNLQGSWISGRRHVPVMNRLHGLWSLGTLSGGLGAIVANAAGADPLAHLAVVAAIMAVLLAILTRYVLRSDEQEHAADGEEAPTGASAKPGRLPIVLLVLAGMFAVMAEVTGGDWAAFRLTDDFDADDAVGSLAFVAYTVGMTTMRFAGDWLEARLGRVRLHHVSIAIAAAGFVLASLIPAEVVAVMGFTLVGVGVATFMPKLYDDAARVPGRRGSGLGAMTAGLNLAGLVAPVIVGGLAGTALEVGGALAVVTLPALAGLALTSAANQRLHQRG